MARTDDDTWDLASSVGATATMVAAGRALASNDPRGLIDDPFARPLVEAVGIDFFTRQVTGELDTTGMDAQSIAFVQMMVDGIALRTKYFDTFFLDAATIGIRQAVILACGLDARAYRLAWPAGMVVYEIDQPQVIEFKTTTLAELGAQPTAERCAVAVDLRDDWPAALHAAGFDAGAPTAWSAEGLLQYLPPDAQDRLLDAITGLSAMGSAVAADYDTGATTSDRNEVAAITATWQQRGFGLDMPSLQFSGERNDVGEYLSARGWRMTGSPVAEVATRYGLQTRVMGPLATTVYASGTRVHA
ncbi:class I SAM-dependent methyltransferase [Mycobacterium sp.]|uniref:class I SAM-dependent methyltransferase n=1 Tax=Mycobacterium sp. TaxID=1785 RepID=UPI0031D18040